MKLATCILLLVLPRTLVGGMILEPSTIKQQEDTTEADNTFKTETTISSSSLEMSLKTSIKQHEDIQKDNETIRRRNESTIVTPGHPGKLSTTKQPEDSNEDYETTLSSKETTILHQISTGHLLRSTKQQKDISTYNETSIESDEPTSFTPKNNPSLKPNRTKQQGVTTKDQGKEKVLSSKSPSQTLEHKDDTSMSHAKYLTNATTLSIGENGSQLALWTQTATGQTSKTPVTESKPKEFIVTRDDQKFNNFKSTIKDVIHTEGKKTTRSAEKESFKTQAYDSTPFQKTPEVTTIQPQEEVQSAATMSTIWSTLYEEKGHTNPPKFNVTDSNRTLDSSTKTNQHRINDSATITTTSFSTGYPFVNPENSTSHRNNTTNIKATYKTTTKGMIRETKTPTLPTTTTPRKEIRKITITSPAPIRENNNPGPIVASLIGCILLLMVLAFVVIFVRNHQRKKKQMQDTDWAGPSPFIDSDINPNPNPPTTNVDGSFIRHESKIISLHSFLPKRFSKRLSLLSRSDEELPLDKQASSVFGQHHLQPPNGQATPPNQIQIQEANSPPAEVSKPNVPETASVPPPSENNEVIQTPPILEDTRIQSPPAETNAVDPTTFEEVDLNVSPDNSHNAESSPSTDSINIPTPPPLAPS